jgi:hypothetical protein
LNQHGLVAQKKMYRKIKKRKLEEKGSGEHLVISTDLTWHPRWMAREGTQHPRQLLHLFVCVGEHIYSSM